MDASNLMPLFFKMGSLPSTIVFIILKTIGGLNKTRLERYSDNSYSRPDPSHLLHGDVVFDQPEYQANGLLNDSRYYWHLHNMRDSMRVSLAWLSALTLLQHCQQDGAETVGHEGRSSNAHRPQLL
jgi:hypothetical protein